jgi:hypothetical protein
MFHTRITAHTPHWRRTFPILCLAAACGAGPLHAGTVAETTGPRMLRVGAEHTRGDPYVLVRDGGGVTKVGPGSPDAAAIKQLKRSIGGDFLWFRDEGKAYVVQDRALLDQVALAWAPLERLGKEMEAHGEQMKQHGDVMKSLGVDMTLAAVTFRPSRMEKIGKKMEEAGKPMEAIGKKMEVLGKQMEKEGENADKVVRGLIRESLANGQARPLPRKG